MAPTLATDWRMMYLSLILWRCSHVRRTEEMTNSHPSLSPLKRLKVKFTQTVNPSFLSDHPATVWFLWVITKQQSAVQHSFRQGSGEGWVIQREIWNKNRHRGRRKEYKTKSRQARGGKETSQSWRSQTRCGMIHHWGAALHTGKSIFLFKQIYSLMTLLASLFI